MLEKKYGFSTITWKIRVSDLITRPLLFLQFSWGL
ncbi:MAG: hypothetical protein GXY80_03890 [Syntrophorhabdus aromaticivorans]|uniref:Uncharacterized protein n=1 Tax=Syntrophorhabdus aromaticivorans TaxID=328301 RepID=A0A971M326_9BACT|nr:hypothetical protein [Syntrophorhabdus aromaticivorans]